MNHAAARYSDRIGLPNTSTDAPHPQKATRGHPAGCGINLVSAFAGAAMQAQKSAARNAVLIFNVMLSDRYGYSPSSPPCERA